MFDEYKGNSIYALLPTPIEKREWTYVYHDDTGEYGYFLTGFDSDYYGVTQIPRPKSQTTDPYYLRLIAHDSLEHPNPDPEPHPYIFEALAIGAMIDTRLEDLYRNDSFAHDVSDNLAGFIQYEISKPNWISGVPTRIKYLNCKNLPEYATAQESVLELYQEFNTKIEESVESNLIYFDNDVYKNTKEHLQQWIDLWLHYITIGLTRAEIINKPHRFALSNMYYYTVEALKESPLSLLAADNLYPDFTLTYNWVDYTVQLEIDDDDY